MVQQIVSKAIKMVFLETETKFKATQTLISVIRILFLVNKMVSEEIIMECQATKIY